MGEEKKLLTVSASPHAKSAASVRRIMLDVILALTPTLIAGIVIFGFRAAVVTAVCVGCSVLFEMLFVLLRHKKQTVGDLSAVVTGLLLGLSLPVTIPLWMCVIGSFIAIVIVKQFFGGIGKNFANPALTARIVLLVSFASAMTKFVSPAGADAVTSATPLASLNGIAAGADVSQGIAGAVSSGSMPGLLPMFLGNHAGCIGEVSAAAILIGAIYLLARRVISGWIPPTYVGTVAVFSLLFGKGDLAFTAYELLGGGLLIGAFFMATDYTTSPVNRTGKVIYGIGCGLLTAVIRFYGSLPEGTSYAILLMNILTPLIEKVSAPRFFGFVKKKKEAVKS